MQSARQSTILSVVKPSPASSARIRLSGSSGHGMRFGPHHTTPGGAPVTNLYITILDRMGGAPMSLRKTGFDRSIPVFLALRTGRAAEI